MSVSHPVRAQESPSAPAGGAASSAHVARSASPAPPGGGRTAGRARSGVSDAILPGFEMLADGSTRLFVELSRPVTYEARSGHGSITYVLKEARVDRRNNQNPLVTVHFNTPVTSARLQPHGRDVWFVIALRSAVQPAVAMDAGKDGGVVMRIEFPKGDYVRPGAPADRGSPSSGDVPDESTPEPTTRTGR